MGTLDREQLAHVARLARIALTEDELTRFARELPDILQGFSALPDDVAIDEDAPTGLPRADVIDTPDAEVRDRIIAAFPRRNGDLASVPRGL